MVPGSSSLLLFVSAALVLLGYTRACCALRDEPQASVWAGAQVWFRRLALGGHARSCGRRGSGVVGAADVVSGGILTVKYLGAAYLIYLGVQKLRP